MATKKRRLTDLYVTGKTVVIDDGLGEPIEVWLQKMNPVEQELVIRKANRARAEVLAAQKDPDGDIYENAQTEVHDFMRDKKGIIEYLTAEREAQIQAAVESELSLEEEWIKDDYLQGLRDAWYGGLDEEYAEDPESVEAKRVFNELQRFSESATEIAKKSIEDVRESYQKLSDEELLAKATDKYLQVQADIAWMTEYRKSELWIALRDPGSHRDRYFDRREDLDELQNATYTKLLQELSDLTIDPDEGKG